MNVSFTQDKREYDYRKRDRTNKTQQIIVKRQIEQTSHATTLVMNVTVSTQMFD